jgi:type I restriction enzyme S subunit
MSFPRHGQYKPSGLKLLGDVPMHWERTALKYLGDYQNGYPFKPEDRADQGLPIIRISQLSGDTEPNLYDGTLDDRVFVQDGDLLFSWSATIDSFVWTGGPAWLNQHIFKVTPTGEAHKGFLFYVIKHIAPKLAEFDAHGSTMRHIKKESLGERIFVPSIDEQAKIAAFLDRETAKIDSLIAEQTRLIELLREKRQAVISQAVTKGLNPNVPMKDSGVEWLGRIPVHWEVTALKRLCATITDGAHISPETEGGVFPFISTRDVSEDRIDFDECLKTTKESFDLMVRSGCRPRAGDVLFSKDGTIGRTVVVHEDRDFVVASSLIIIRPTQGELRSDYLNVLCQSNVVSRQVDGFVKGAGLPRLSIQNLRKVIGVFPPVDEQREIAAFVSRVSQHFEALGLAARETMGLLQERRAALISAAVTGKIDVRGLVPQPEAVAA